METKTKFNSYTQQPKDPVSWEIKQAAAERWNWQHCQYSSDEGCRLIRKIATSREFNRYRGLYTMPTVTKSGPPKKTINHEQPLENMAQEAFKGMLLYKDDFTGEPKEIIFKAIRKHFKKLYREANAADRDLDNGRHNASIEPKQKPLKVLIDELDFDPEKEPESVKQANNIRNWRIGGISKDYYNRAIIHFFDEIDLHQNVFKMMQNDDWIYQANEGWNCRGNYIITPRPEKFMSGVYYDFYYRRTQTKTAAKKLKIETEISYKYKRKDEAAALELINLHHAAIFPDHKQPDKKKIFLQPGAVSYNRFTDTNYINGRIDLIAMLKESLYIINAMQQPQAFITKLYYYQGLTQAEISALLHRSNRKVQLAREAGLEEIKQHFTKHYPLSDIDNILKRVRKQILNREIFPL